MAEPDPRNGDKALKALDIIKEAIREQRSIRIQNAQGEDVTDVEFDNDADSGYETDGDRDEIILGIVRRQTGHEEGILAQEAVLISEGEAVRQKADAWGVTVIAASVIQRLLERRRSRTSSSSSIKL